MSKKQEKAEANTANDVRDESADDAVTNAVGTAGSEPGVSADELAALKEQAAKAQENWDKYVRLNADFDNFKKRAAKDRLDAIKYANEALIERLLPVVDNFEAAMAAVTATDTASIDSLVTGVKMISGQLKGVLAESGLEEIDATGKAFDPMLHEALSQQPSADLPEGQVLQQVRKGYRFKERLLRPAAVVVAAKATAGEADESVGASE